MVEELGLQNEILKATRLAISDGHIHVTRKALEQCDRFGIDDMDLCHVISRCDRMTMGYAVGCYTISGATIDQEQISVVVHPRTDGFVDVITCWRSNMQN